MALWNNDERAERGYVIVMHDITRLHDLSRFKDEMLRVASHDLRSPLALISGYADMVSMDTPDPTSPVHEYVNIIKQSVEKMGGLVEDLLRVERIRSSPLELHEQIDLNALVKVVVVNARPFAHTKKLDFQTDIELDNVPRVFADSVLLRQAMENLINNAVKYTPENGQIIIRAYYDHQRFHFSVEDTGIGIPKEHQSYVFESFYRVTPPKEHNKSRIQSSGLGLSLVKNVIARHHGEVWVNSTVGKGSRFGFWLPLIDKPADEENLIQTS
jgi:signal transduction histidine kinase